MLYCAKTVASTVTHCVANVDYNVSKIPSLWHARSRTDAAVPHWACVKALQACVKDPAGIDPVVLGQLTQSET